MKLFLDQIIERMVKKIMRIVSREAQQIVPLYSLLSQNAIARSAEYIEKNMNRAMIFKDRESLWLHATKKIQNKGLWLEFGVHSGYSINILSSLTDDTVHGFDSFEGLQEDWRGTDLEAGFFSLNGDLPSVRSNVVLHKGWFSETLPPFLSTNSEKIALLHLDADTYESTKFILSCLDSKSLSGTVIIFDEYLGMTNWENGEFKAWREFVEKHKIKYDYLGVAKTQTSIIVIE